jgi:hypothetical protein
MAWSVRAPGAGKLVINVANTAPPGLVLMEYDIALDSLWGVGIYCKVSGKFCLVHIERTTGALTQVIIC